MVVSKGCEGKNFLRRSQRVQFQYTPNGRKNLRVGVGPLVGGEACSFACGQSCCDDQLRELWTAEVIEHLDWLRLMMDVPQGSICDGCEDWAYLRLGLVA